MQIRPERAGDFAAIQAVHASCFPSLYEAKLVDALRAAGKLSISLIAEVDGKIVGHVAFSPVTLEDAPDGLGLGNNRGLAIDTGCGKAHFVAAVVVDG